MALAATVIPGKVFTDADMITPSNLNALGEPTVSIEGVVGADALGTPSVQTANIYDANVTLVKLAPDAIAAMGTGITTQGTRGLVIAPETGHTATQVRIIAAEAVLKTAAGVAKCYTTVSLVADIAGGVTPGGLENGTSEAADAWYYIWLIGKADGTIDALLSASATAPTLTGAALTDYIYYTLVGAVRNTGGNFVAFYQTDNRVWMPTASVGTLTASGSGNITFAAAVPPNAKVVLGHIEGVHETATYVYVSSSAAGIGQTPGNPPFDFRIALMEAAKVYWQNSAFSNKTLSIVGYEF